MFQKYFARGKVGIPIISSILIMLIGLSSCGGGNTNITALDSQNPITIGISISQTKDFASDGKATLQGYQLWADRINQNGGLLGRPVKLDVLNDSSDPDQTAKNYTTLISQHHVNLIFGPFSSLLTKAAAPVAKKYGYAFLEGSGGAPSVFDPTVVPQDGWNGLFDTSVPVVNNLVTFAYYILSLPQSLRPKTAAYLTSDDPFTFPQVDLARELLTSGGVKTVYNFQFPEGNDSTPFAEKVVQSRADIAVLGNLLPDIKTDVQVFKKDHYNPSAIIGTAGPDAGQDFINAVGGVKYTEGIFVPNGWDPQANNFQNAIMVQAYLNQYGGTADQINADVAEAFSVGQVLEQAVNTIKTIDNKKLITYMHSGAVFSTVQGTAQFKPDGENGQAIAYMFQWQAGNFIPVYPLSVAQENPQYPKQRNY